MPLRRLENLMDKYYCTALQIGIAQYGLKGSFRSFICSIYLWSFYEADVGTGYPLYRNYTIMLP